MCSAGQQSRAARSIARVIVSRNTAARIGATMLCDSRNSSLKVGLMAIKAVQRLAVEHVEDVRLATGIIDDGLL